MLELIDKGSTTEAHPSPMLFVHGGMHAAWCWDEHFLDYFASQGFRAAAVSFRAHGGSGSDKPLKKLTIADYVQDVHAAAQRLGTPPIVVGHSLGGFTLQHYLMRHHAPAGVLMASLPPKGVRGSARRAILHHPWISLRANAFGESKEIFTRRPREALFSRDTPQDVVDATAARCENESIRASFIDAGLRLPKPALVSTPLLVLGAEEDGMVSAAEVRATARAYGTSAEMFPNMGHNMMVDLGWWDVAERIRGWLSDRNL
jgi:pimeloyl-ACP methyl ester carboxylesterase